MKNFDDFCRKLVDACQSLCTFVCTGTPIDDCVHVSTDYIYVDNIHVFDDTTSYEHKCLILLFFFDILFNNHL